MTNNIYNNNLRCLRRKNPQLYELIEGHTSDGRQHEIATPSGHYTLLSLMTGSEPRYLHSPQDPLQEAQQLLAGFEFHGEDITVLLGCGLGYLPLAICGRMHPEHHLVIVEADLGILAQACRLIDLSPLLTDERVRIFHTQQLSAIWDALEKEQLKIIAGTVAKLMYPPSFELNPQAYRKIETEIESLVAAQKEGFNTLESYWEMSLQNILGNLGAMAEATAIDRLFATAVDRPALIVAAGPSLDKNISRIKAVKGCFVIIATDTALKPLMAEGIQPDLVISIDPNARNLEKIDQLPAHSLRLIPLVFSPLVFHEVPYRFSGVKFVFSEPHCFCQWAVGAMGLRRPAAELPYGFSVAHFAFYLARAMGADPIIFVGLDLAFALEGDQARNSAMQWQTDLNRPELIKVPGVNGKEVVTCEGFAKMITLFEREIARTKARCVDATEGGALIRGARIMTLKEAIERWIFKGASGFAETIKKIGIDHQSRPAAMRAGLTWAIDQATLIQGYCDTALSLLKPALGDHTGAVGESDQTKEIFQKINQIADQMDTHSRFVEIIKDFMGNVIANQYQLRFQLERVHDPLERSALEAQKAQIYFERLQQITGNIIKYGSPVLKSYKSKCEVS